MVRISESLHLTMLRIADAESVRIDGREIEAVFLEPSLEQEPGGFEVQTSAPQLTCRTVDVADVQEGAHVVVRGTSYRVIANTPDGRGESIVTLRRP